MPEPILPVPPIPTDRPLPATPGPLATARHPSPLVHVPRRGRKPRIGYERIETPVRLLVAADADFAPVAKAGDPELVADFYQEEAYAYGGAVFSPLGMGTRDARPEEFIAYLARRESNIPDGRVWGLAGTPLAAFGESRTGNGWDGVDEGRERERIDPGAVLHEAREAAAAGLRRFLAEDIVLTPTRAMRRRPPLADLRLQHAESDVLLMPDPALDLSRLPLVRPDRVRDLAAAFARPHLAPPAEADILPVEARFPADLVGDDDLFVLANLLPARTLFILDGALTDPVIRRAGRTDTVEATRARILPIALLGRMGAVPPRGAAASLEACASALRDLEAAASGRIDYLGGAHTRNVPGLLRYVEEHALPRLGAGPARLHGTEDAEALMGLAR